MANAFLTLDEMRELIGDTLYGKIMDSAGVMQNIVFEEYRPTEDFAGFVNPYETNINAPYIGNRQALRFDADVTNISMYQLISERICEITIPIYAKNVKYFQLPFYMITDTDTAWAQDYDTIAAKDYAEIQINNGSVENIPIFKGTDNHAGVCRIGGNMGYNAGASAIIPEFTYDALQGAANYSVLKVRFSCVITSTRPTLSPYKLSVYICSIYANDDILFMDSPERIENFGDTSTLAGGNGTFDDTATYNRGDNTGTLVASYATEINTALSSLGCFNPATGNGFNIYSVLSEPTALPDLFADMYDGASTWLSRYQFLQYNPMSAFLAFHLMPTSLVSLAGTQKALTASGYNFLLQPDNPVPQLEVVNPICALHIGSFDFTHYFDGFADFAPYTKIYLHLPFCGVMQIDVNAVMYGYLSVDYLADAISGNVSAFVTCCDKNGRTQILYNSTGNCAYSLPLFSETQSAAATGKILSGIVSGGIGAMMGGGLSSAAGIAETLLPFAVTGTMPRHTDVSGTFGGNNAMITDTQCYLEIVRPEWVNPETYAELESIPAEIGGTITDLELMGKTIISKIETDNISCTDEEKKEIARILSEGIYIRE